MTSGPNGWRRVRIRLVRSWLRGACAPYLLVGTAALSAAALATAVKVNSFWVGWICLSGLIALGSGLWFGLRRLQVYSFDQPANARSIADLLSLEPEPVIARVLNRHAAWREHAPTQLLTLSQVDIWCRSAGEEQAASVRPMFPAYNAAIAQDRGFLTFQRKS